MDYEFRIRLLEKDLAHYREMQQLLSAHVEAHDSSIESLGQIAERTSRNLEELSAEVKIMAANMNLLIKALLGEHKNGSAE